MKITFKQFILEGLIGYHSTTKAGLQSIERDGFRPQANEHRLFPNSISFTRQRNSYGGDTVIRAELNVKPDQILKLTMTEFWNEAEDGEEITPVQLGKRWSKKALDAGKSVIIISGVPGIGTEICVLDASIIGATKLVESATTKKV